MKFVAFDEARKEEYETAHQACFRRTKTIVTRKFIWWAVLRYFYRGHYNYEADVTAKGKANVS